MFVKRFLIGLEPMFIPYNSALDATNRSLSPRKAILTCQFHFYTVNHNVVFISIQY